MNRLELIFRRVLRHASCFRVTRRMVQAISLNPLESGVGWGRGGRPDFLTASNHCWKSQGSGTWTGPTLLRPWPATSPVEASKLTWQCGNAWGLADPVSPYEILHVTILHPAIHYRSVIRLWESLADLLPLYSSTPPPISQPPLYDPPQPTSPIPEYSFTKHNGMLHCGQTLLLHRNSFQLYFAIVTPFHI